MDPERFGRVRFVFEAALEVPPAERTAWLEQACAGDRALLEEVARLLATDDADPSHPLLRTHGAIATIHSPDLVGKRLGAYTLVRWIGAGGMGTVYEALEERPHRRVAVKTLGAGLLHDRARRRFEDEVEILARLRHPGIAQVLGAGTWREDGLEVPWFAMELVEDPRPLDRYAREECLSLSATTALVLKVCDAVQFAHRRGVIHRDLKPANILVDRGGAPKIIDFGIARLLGDELTAQRTATGELLGTLAYMSPERLTGGTAAADAGSDVYALGVILYELTAGQPPFALEHVPPAKAMDLLRDQDPAPPSTRSQRLQLPAELDWIALKAMAREPAQRYASAAELAADLDRFERDEPLAAGPPSAGYRLRKLARRHRVALIAAAACLATVIAGAVVAVAGWVQAARAEQVAEQRRSQAQREATTLAEVNRLQQEILRGSAVDGGGRDARVADLLDNAAVGIDSGRIGDPVVEVGLRSAIGVSYLGLGLLAEADRQFQRALDLVAEHDLDPHTSTIAALHNNVGSLRTAQGQLERAERFLRTALAGQISAWGEAHDETATTQANLALVLLGSGQHAEALGLAEQAARTLVQRRGDASPATIGARTVIASACSAMGRDGEADAMFQELLEQARTGLGPDHAATNRVRNGLATHLWKLGRKAEYAVVAREILDSHSRKRGELHPSTLVASNNLAAALRDEGDLAGAEAILRRVVAAESQAGTDRGLNGMLSRQNLAFVLRLQKKLDEAEAMIARLRSDAARELPEGHWLAAMLQKEHGACLRDRGRFAEAEAPLSEAADSLARTVGANDFRTIKAVREVVALYEAWGRPDAAAEWSARVAGAK